MKKNDKIKSLEKRLGDLEIKHEKQVEMTSDLLDYLMRVDDHFINHPGSMDGWYMRLVQLRNEDEKLRQCMRARRLLEEEGFVVAADPSEMDAARMKKWVKSGMIKTDDDDFPF